MKHELPVSDSLSNSAWRFGLRHSSSKPEILWSTAMRCLVDMEFELRFGKLWFWGFGFKSDALAKKNQPRSRHLAMPAVS